MTTLSVGPFLLTFLLAYLRVISLVLVGRLQTTTPRNETSKWYIKAEISQSDVKY